MGGQCTVLGRPWLAMKVMTKSFFEGFILVIPRIAIAERGAMFDPGPVCFYVDKIAVGPECAGGVVNLARSPTVNVHAIAKAKRKAVADVTCAVLDRDRHVGLVEELRLAGARIKLIADGDVEAALATCDPESGVDALFGVGGAESSLQKPINADARADEKATEASASAGLLEETAPERGALADMLGLEKRISKQQDLIMKQSTTIMRLRETGAPTEQIEKEQKTLERMKIGLQGLLRSFSFSQVEARTTMVKAATEMQEIAEEAGLEPPPLEGFMQNIFGKKATSAAVGAATGAHSWQR